MVKSNSFYPAVISNAAAWQDFPAIIALLLGLLPPVGMNFTISAPSMPSSILFITYLVSLSYKQALPREPSAATYLSDASISIATMPESSSNKAIDDSVYFIYDNCCFLG